MQLVDRATSAGYSYVSPVVDKACNVVPLLGGVKKRLEPYAPPLIQRADLCLDAIYTGAENRATALRGAITSAEDKVLDLKTSVCIKAQEVIWESPVVTRVHKMTLAFVDTMDLLIDRYLPLEETSREVDDMTEAKSTPALIPRMLHLPIKIPARMVHITIMKMQSGSEVVQVHIRWAVQLTSDQKAKYKAMVLSQSRAIADRAASSSLAVSLQKGKQDASKKVQAALTSLADGKKAVGVKCYVVCERLYIIELKDVTVKNVGIFQQSIFDVPSGIATAASKHAYYVTTLIAGKDRATGIFTTIGKRLPIVKAAIRSSASTGALSDTSSDSDQKSEQKVASSTGMVCVPPLVQLVENQDQHKEQDQDWQSWTERQISIEAN
jgi:hypothetical protein